MAGLGTALQEQPPAAPTSAAPIPGAPAAPMGAPEPAMEEGEAASPEEQELYNQFVAGGMLMLFDKAFVPRFKDMISEGDVPNGIGEAVAQIGGRIAQEAHKKGKQLPGDVILHGSLELTEQAGELAEKLTKQELDEPALETAYYTALERLRPILQQSGLSDEQDEQENASTVEALQKTDQWGEIMSMIQQAQQGGSGREMLEEAI